MSRRDGSFVHITVRVPEGVGIRGSNGRYIENVMQSHIRRRNQIMATQLQELVAATLERKRVPSRRAVSSKRLKNAILDPQNQVVSNAGNPYLGVGKLSFLNKSEAKYWRTIEMGTNQFMGMPIYGIWGGSLTGGYRQAPSGKYPIAGPGYTGFGTGSLGVGDPSRSGRLRPMGRKRAYAFLRAQGMTSHGAHLMSNSAGYGAHIENEIKPTFYFRDAWAAFRPEDRAQEALDQALREAFRAAG